MSSRRQSLERVFKAIGIGGSFTNHNQDKRDKIKQIQELIRDTRDHLTDEDIRDILGQLECTHNTISQVLSRYKDIPGANSSTDDTSTACTSVFIPLSMSTSKDLPTTPKSVTQAPQIIYNHNANQRRFLCCTCL